MAWVPPKIGTRPVAILAGTGLEGCRIACAFVAGGYKVHLQVCSDLLGSEDEAGKFIEGNALKFAESITHRTTPSRSQLGTYKVWGIGDLKEAITNAWLVIDATSWPLDGIIEAFTTLDNNTPTDCILATSSSYLKSSELLEKVSPARRKLICNVHFLLLSGARAVELMTDGETHTKIFPFLGDVFKVCGMTPTTVQKESRGLISHRLLQAVRREALTMLEEGVGDPAQIDHAWESAMKSGGAPCRAMDRIGLHTVANIEEVYCQERGLDPKHVNFLRAKYVSKGKYGSGFPEGGLYPPGSSSGN